MALDGTHEVRKVGAPAMRPCTQNAWEAWRGLDDENKSVQNFVKRKGQATQNNPAACHPKDLQRKLVCFASMA